MHKFLDIYFKACRIFLISFDILLVLFIGKIVESHNYYPYASFYDIKSLPNFGLNVNNPVDALNILSRNNLPSVNIFGAIYGLINIGKNYNLTIKELMKLPNAKSALMSANHIPPLNSDQLSIWKNIANITTKTEVDTLCYQIREYAITSNKLVKCHIYQNHLNIFAVEELYSEKPKVLLIHDYFSKREINRWDRNWHQISKSKKAVHMKTLYDSELSYSNHLHDTMPALEEFKNLLHFRREGKIGFYPHSKFTFDSETKLRKLLQNVLRISFQQTEFEDYQGGTYGIGGFIHEHLDTYGSQDNPMEDILDMNNDEIRSNWKGDRLISTLGYLQGSWQQGGSTIFPNLGISVPLIQGNLLLWENLDTQTLNPLENSVHRSCPIIYGPKLVLNKWLRSL